MAFLPTMIALQSMNLAIAAMQASAYRRRQADDTQAPTQTLTAESESNGSPTN